MLLPIRVDSILNTLVEAVQGLSSKATGSSFPIYHMEQLSDPDFDEVAINSSEPHTNCTERMPS